MWVQLIAIYQGYICKLPVDKDSGVEAKPVILASAVAARLMLAALEAFACPAEKVAWTPFLREVRIVFDMPLGHQFKINLCLATH